MMRFGKGQREWVDRNYNAHFYTEGHEGLMFGNSGDYNGCE